MQSMSSSFLAMIIGLWVLLGIGQPAYADLNLANELVARGDYKSAAQELETLANENNPEAQERLGDLYIAGKGVYPNFSTAAHWYRRAAVQERASAQYKIGYLHHIGIGVPMYVEKAAQWYDFAAKQGHFLAQIRYALMAPSLANVGLDQAMVILGKAATRGSHLALAKLETISATGYQLAQEQLASLSFEARKGPSIGAPLFNSLADKGVAALAAGDLLTAIAIFKKMADQKTAGGLFGLGLIHQIGPDLPKSPLLAGGLYADAINNGSVEAMVNLGLLYWGTLGHPRNRLTAKSWLNKAAGNGSERAVEVLKLLATDPVDLESLQRIRFKSAKIISATAAKSGYDAYGARQYISAVGQLKELAEQKNPDGQLALGLIVEQGIPSLENKQRAVDYYRAAAKTGDAGAQVNLANIYRNGFGVEQNDRQAMALYEQAASTGDPLAETVLGYLSLFSSTAGPLGMTKPRDLIQQASDKKFADAMNILALLELQNQSEVSLLPYEVSARTAYSLGAGKRANLISTLSRKIGPASKPAVDLLTAAANAGHRAAQHNLARLYARSPGLSSDSLVQAFKWFTIAFHNGQLTAADERRTVLGKLNQSQRILAEWEIASTLKPRQITTPLEVVEAMSGTPEEQWAIGIKYRYGKGYEKDYKKAFEWFLSAAHQGHSIAQRDLGTLYRRGLGIRKSYENAAKWFRLSANQGYGKAQRDLGILHQFGNGVPKDHSEAVRWYQKAADQGDRKAQSNLAFMYRTGRGVSKDQKKAVEWYLKAANQGSSTAQKYLGMHYQFGQGVEMDMQQSVKWYRMSAEQGNLKAQENLGFMYKSGQGVERDFVEAAKWYFAAAKQNSARAQNILGMLYHWGKGVEQNHERALIWYTRALKQGYTKTYPNLVKLVRSVDGPSPHYVELFDLIKKDANKGTIAAINLMGLGYWYGKAGEKNKVTAEKWFDKAIKLKNKEAETYLLEMKLDKSDG